jgi:putative transposase
LFNNHLRVWDKLYYNSNHDRRGSGTLWHDRFKSVLVEESESAQVTVAAYIDLNPVRAGMVEDAKEYRWSGYGAAVERGGQSLNGIGKLFCGMDLNKRKVLAQYRKTLYCEGVCRLNAFMGAVSKSGFTQSVIDKVFD